MVAVESLLVQVLDSGLLLAGVVCLVAGGWYAVGRGWWHDPLAGAAGPGAGPTWSAILASVGLYLSLLYLGAGLALFWTAPSASRIPGSSAWHVAHLAESAARLVTGCFLIRIYLRYAAAIRAEPLSPARGMAAAFVATLITIALTTPQLQMGRVLWELIHPGEPLPSHVVLTGLAQSQWGNWGALQLAVSAVLLAPFSEELLFRGLVLDCLRRDLGRAWPAILLSAVCFAGVHAQPQDILPLVTMGILLGYLRVRTGRIWPCVLTHLLFNGRTIVVALLSLNGSSTPG